MFNPFSKNIIFIDTEFTSLDPYEGELLSIGLVKFNGKELYLELEQKGEISEWVKENVVPFLDEKKISRQEAIVRIKKFIGKGNPYMVAYVNQFDTIYLYKLFGIENDPFFWIPIDFASILFALNINPEKYSKGEDNGFYKKIGVEYERYRKHHALDDARLLREVYLKLLDINKINKTK